jgi:hypothetical protein
VPSPETPEVTLHEELAGALAQVLASDPRVVGFGEAHAPADFAGRSTALRFTAELLPALAPRAYAVVVELLAPEPGCMPERAAAEREASAITEGQAESNQEEYLALGRQARRLGVRAEVPRADCAALRRVAEAGQEGVLVLMELVASESAALAERLLREAPEGRRVLLYGGALHNDLTARAGLEAWSYAAALDAASRGRYAEVDLIVPELVRDTESWRRFAWYAAVTALPADHRYAVVQTGLQSFALVWPAEAPEVPSSVEGAAP